MADDRYDYYRSDDERENDVYLDNRTGVGAPRGRGYRASFETGRGGGRPDHGRAYGEDDARNHYRDQGYSTYGNRPEGRSFRPDDGRSSESARDYQTGAYRASRTFGHDPSRSAYDGDPNFGRDPGYPRHLARDQDAHQRHFWNRAGDTVATWLGDDEARRRHEADLRASHRGKGPKSYKRSDERIREDVNERLTDDLWLDAGNVEVQVKDSEVTLSGTVTSRDDRRYAERIAESVSGATHVQNNLRVDDNRGRDQGSSNAQSDILARQAAGKH